MKLRDFQLPTKIKWMDLNDSYGKLSGEPFEKGYAHTIGNSLRRILLSSLVGSVITSVKIEGAPHEYASLSGVKEDVMEIIFNLKQLRFKIFTDEPQRITLETSGAGEIKGSDFKLTESMKLMNPENHIATLSDNAKLYIEATVEQGRGYRPVTEKQREESQIGEIPLDASFSPIKKVNYDVDIARVGQAMDYDRLILEVWSDGSVTPPIAVAYASQILQQTTEAFDVPEIKVELGDTDAALEAEKEKMLDLPLQELNFSTRLENLLSGEAQIKTIGDLVAMSRDEIGETPGLGDKYLQELDEKLDKFNSERETQLQLKVTEEEK